MPELQDLPNEVLAIVFKQYVLSENLRLAFKARLTCREFATGIGHELLATLPVEDYVNEWHECANRESTGLPVAPRGFHSSCLDLILNYAGYYLMCRAHHLNEANPYLPTYVNKLADRMVLEANPSESSDELREQYLVDLVSAVIFGESSLVGTMTRLTAFVPNFAFQPGMTWDDHLRPEDKLAAAAAVGDLSTARRVVERGVALIDSRGFRQSMFQSPFLAAAVTGKTSFLRFLLEKVVFELAQTREHQDDTAVSELEELIFYETTKVVRKTIDAKQPRSLKMLLRFLQEHFPDKLERGDYTYSLTWNMAQGCVPCFEIARDHFRTTIIPGKSLDGALRAACTKGYISMLRYVLENGIATLPQDAEDFLKVAISNGWRNICDILVQYGAQSRGPALYEAALRAPRGSETTMVRYLLEKGVPGCSSATLRTYDMLDHRFLHLQFKMQRENKRCLATLWGFECTEPHQEPAPGSIFGGY